MCCEVWHKKKNGLLSVRGKHGMRQSSRGGTFQRTGTGNIILYPYHLVALAWSSGHSKFCQWDFMKKIFFSSYEQIGKRHGRKVSFLVKYGYLKKNNSSTSSSFRKRFLSFSCFSFSYLTDHRKTGFHVRFLGTGLSPNNILGKFCAIGLAYQRTLLFQKSTVLCLWTTYFRYQLSFKNTEGFDNAMSACVSSPGWTPGQIIPPICTCSIRML